MPGWWNVYTTVLRTVASNGLGVQVPLPAPQFRRQTVTVKELIRELEDMPENAVVLLDQTASTRQPHSPLWTRPDAVSIQFLNQELDYTNTFIDGEWLQDMEDPPEEFVVLQ